MPQLLTIEETIEVGDVAGPLAATYATKGTVYRPRLVKPVPPVMIAVFTDILRWAYDGGAASAQTQRNIANYLYWMCGQFQLEAQNIISGPGGGSVVPTPSGGGAPNDVDFIVDGTTFIATGEYSGLFDGTGGRPDLRGYNVEFYRGGTVQYTTPQLGGGAYYAWNSVTGLLSLFPNPGLGIATVDEAFRISPKTGGGAATVTPSATYPFSITSADFEDDGVTYLNSNITADTLVLFASNTPNPVLYQGTDFIHVAGGIQITLPGFDASSFDYTIIVQKLN